MKVLSGLELAGFIKERQAKQVRNLRQSWGVKPRLAIVQNLEDPVIDTYVRLKRAYGEDILVDVDVHQVASDKLSDTIISLNDDDSVHGIIVQLPLVDMGMTDSVINSVSVDKDVDGLVEGSEFIAATPLAIDWLLVGYGVELKEKKVAIVGHGRLVGAPLAQLWRGQGRDVTVFDEGHADSLAADLRDFDVIVTAVGKPRLILSKSVRPGAVVVDAATSSESGKLVGDLAEDVRERDDLTITPVRGGVGPLTVAALFDNVIAAARNSVGGER